MLQSTEYEAIDTPTTQGGDSLKDKFFFYDSEGSLLDSKNGTSSDDETAKVYVAKLIFSDQNIPSETSKTYYEQKTIARKGFIVVGKSTKLIVDLMQGLQDANDVLKPEYKSKIHWLPVLIAKTDGVQSQKK